MTLLGRAPREVYRVYTEEEFFGADEIFACGEDGLGGGVASAGPFAPAGPSGMRERRLRRLAGVAALAGAVGATFAATGPWAPAGAGRRAVADSRVAAPTRTVARASVPGARRADEAAPPVRRQLADAGLLRPRGEHLRPGALRDAAPIRRWRGGEYAPRYADAVLTSRTAPAPALARPNGAPVDVASANAAPVDVATTTAIGASATTPQPQHAEFGFER
jgi:hypothetical protein